MAKEQNIKTKINKKKDNKSSGISKKQITITLGELFGGLFIVLICILIVGSFYFFLKKDDIENTVLEENDYVKFNHGSFNINDALNAFEENSFSNFVDNINYELVKKELNKEDLEKVEENIENEVKDLTDYYGSLEEVNNAVSMYTGYKDLDEYKEKEMQKVESYNVYTLKYCDSIDVDEEKCEKYLNYYNIKSLYDLRKDNDIKFMTSSGKKQYDKFMKRVEEDLEKMEEEIKVKEEGYSNIISLNYNDFKEKIDNKENFVVVVTQTGCGHCESYLPKLNSTLAENGNMAVFQVNITDFSSDEKELLSKTLSFSGTPATFFIKKGKVLKDYSFEGDREGDYFIEKLEEANL